MKREGELDLAVRAAEAAGALLQAAFASDAGVQRAEGRDIKTRADVAAEACIKELLLPSGIPILAEESAAGADDWRTGPRWLVDPLDGTMNFSRGFPVCAVSVGLWDGGHPVLGAVFDLGQRCTYSGIVGRGAWRNGSPISVSNVADRAQAILSTGFPTGRNYASDALDQFVRRVQAFKKIRMIGSAAISLVRVADGTFEAYFEEDIMIWDVAAGLALVSAAGGAVDVRPGSRAQSIVVGASNGKVSV